MNNPCAELFKIVTEHDADVDMLIDCPAHGIWVPQPDISYGCPHCRDEIRYWYYESERPRHELPAGVERKAALYMQQGHCYL